MWRTIMLGKLAISILASLAVGGLCASRPWRVDLTFAESAQWIAIGSFFIFLAVVQMIVVFLLTRKKTR